MSDVDWPDHLGRTPPKERKPHKKYEVSIHRAVSDIETTMERMGVDDWRLETNMDHQKDDENYPYSNQPEPEDPSVVLRWTMDGDQHAVGADRYAKVRDNTRTVGLYMEEKRKMGGRDVWTAQSEFATARLPPGENSDHDKEVTVDNPYEVLGITESTPKNVAKAAYDELRKSTHPDQDGDRDEFIRVQKAWEQVKNDPDS